MAVPEQRRRAVLVLIRPKGSPRTRWRRWVRPGSPWSSRSDAVVAAAFSGAVVVYFWLYPARKAAGLNPIEALRYE